MPQSQVPNRPRNRGNSILEDAQALERLAQGDAGPLTALLQRLEPLVRKSEDLLSLHKKYDALYKGVLNLVNYHSRGLVSWMSGEPLDWSSSLEDHHIFPKDY